jgi:hypothetical protein
LDWQPDDRVGSKHDHWRKILRAIGRHADSNCNSNSDGNSNRNGDSYSNTNCYINTNLDPASYSHTEISSESWGASDFSSSPNIISHSHFHFATVYSRSAAIAPDYALKMYVDT